MADEKWLNELRDDITIIKEALKSMVEINNLKLLALEDKLNVANHRIKDLEENNSWLWKAVAGTLIGAAMALLIKK